MVKLKHITIFVSLITIGFASFITYLCVSQEFDFFSLHPLFASIGFLLLTWGILTFRSDNPFIRHVPHARKSRIHWIIQLIAIAVFACGNSIAYSTKENLNRDHFTSWHGTFGVLTVLSALGVSFGGLGALYNLELRKYVKPNFIKAVHGFGGLLVFSFCSLAVLCAISSSQWFTEVTSHKTQLFWTISILFSVVFTIAHPFANVVRRCKLLQAK